MKFKLSKTVLFFSIAFAIATSCTQQNKEQKGADSAIEEERDGYDGPNERDLLELEKTKDPATGKVPSDRLLEAIIQTDYLKTTPASRNLDMNWIERGPIYDSVGPSNGNYRGSVGNPPGTYTSGRMRAVLVDPTDISGNTVWASGVGGGIWKTTNLLDPIPLWQNINDFFDNMSVSSICIDPSNSNIMYFSTGEPTANADAIMGMGIWKSVNHGLTWALLTSTTTFTKTFKLLCDANGNVYAALRAGGLRRSTDGGANWTNIAPTGYTSTSVTDIEISSTGTLHASFGYYTSAGVATYRYTTSPSMVSSTTWSSATGLPTAANRIEMACSRNTVYLCPTSTSNNVFGAYKSIDGGANFTAQQSSTYTTSLSNTQGWYGISLDINPNDVSQFIVGGLDAYRSIDNGATVQRITRWASATPYVHADHHFVKWWTAGGESRVLMATDGGLFLSRDNGVTFADKNRNLGIKQFYSCAIHPTQTDYFLAGAQDNGSHRLNKPGLTYSIEVTGGDGAFVDIDQNEPQFQFTSYVYNQYRRSSNSGSSWSNFNLSAADGLFINPFEYDDVNNKIFASFGARMLRWNNPTTATSVANSSLDTISLTGASGNLTAFLVSPSTNKRLFAGTSTGKLFKIENSDLVNDGNISSNIIDITGPGFSGYLNCVAAGKTDQQLLAIFTNYGINNIWSTSDGGASWTAIDGDLPNMPVRWAVFDPSNANQVIIATETGVYNTSAINGASTIWVPYSDFPTVRTDMLKVRPSDKLILAATHGRGLWSGYSVAVVAVKNISLQAKINLLGKPVLYWTTTGSADNAEFTIQYSFNGTSFTNIATLKNSIHSYTHQSPAAVGYYRVMYIEKNAPSVYSNIAVVRTNEKLPQISVYVWPNPVIGSSKFVLHSTEKGSFSWTLSDMAGRILKQGKGYGYADASNILQIPVNSLGRGHYNLTVVQDALKAHVTFIKE